MTGVGEKALDGALELAMRHNTQHDGMMESLVMIMTNAQFVEW